MEEVAEQLALALDNARLYRQVEEELDERRRAEGVVRRQNVYLSALAETSVGLVQRLDPRALVEDILTRASQLVGTENGYVYLLDREAGEIEMRIGTGVYTSLIGSRLKPGTGLAGTVWQTGQALVLDDYRQWPHRLPSSSRDVLRAVTGVPLKSGEEVIGVLGLAYTVEGKRFDETDMETLERFAQLASIALDNARLFEETQLSLKEKEVLLKEIHHRVKNNLQVVSSLLSLEAGRTKDEKLVQSLKESQARIRSMALIHEKLYQSRDLSRVDFEGYVRNLAVYLIRTYGTGHGAVELQLDVADIRLGIDRAIPCGLILTELITNSLQYGFPDSRGGTITVELRPDGNGGLQLSVHDNGVGLPDNLDIAKSDSLGLQLVSTLTLQLGGQLEIDRSDGTRFSITFPER